MDSLRQVSKDWSYTKLVFTDAERSFDPRVGCCTARISISRKLEHSLEQTILGATLWSLVLVVDCHMSNSMHEPLVSLDYYQPGVIMQRFGSNLFGNVLKPALFRDMAGKFSKMVEALLR